MRKFLAIIGALLIGNVIFGQAAPDFNWQLSGSGSGSTISDQQGNRIALKAYQRIVAVSAGAVETFYLIGAEQHLVAISTSQDGIWPVEKTALLPKVGSPARPSVETIISHQPDLIIFGGMNAALAKDLSGRGYACLIHSANTIEDIFNTTILIGLLTGRESAARALIARQQAQLDLLRRSLQDSPLRLKGAFVYSTSPLMAFTEKSLPGEILEVLGVQNIARGLDVSRPILSPELIVASNPDFLFGAMSIAKPEDLMAADPAIGRTRAGREKNFTIVPSSLFLRPSPRIIDSIMDLYRIIVVLKD